MTFYSANVPEVIGVPNPKVLRPFYKYRAEAYVCIDVALAEKEGVRFYWGHQCAVMTRQTVPPNCFVYWDENRSQTTNDGSPFDEALSINPVPQRPVDPARHTGPSAGAQASADSPGSAGARASAAPWRKDSWYEGDRTGQRHYQSDPSFPPLYPNTQDPHGPPQLYRKPMNKIEWKKGNPKNGRRTTPTRQ